MNKDNFQLSAEEILATESHHLRALIDNLPDYIYFKDANSRFVDANQATVRVMKCKNLEELIGKTDFEFYPREFAQKYFNDESEIFKTGQSKMDIEEPVLDENGRVRIISTSKVALKDKDGKIIGLVGIGRDITERKQAEEVLRRDNETFERMLHERTEKLLEAQAEIKRAKRLSDIGTLAATVAHELRNPLGIIQMASYALSKTKNLAKDKYLEDIEKNLWECSRIIDNLLTYSRIKVPTYEVTDLFDVLNDSIRSLQTRFEGHDIVVEKSFGADNLSIEMDPHQMKEVFVNLLNNAGQALPKKEGKYSGKIEVIVKKESHQVHVAIKDNGTGIAEEDLKKIFMPFFTNKPKGTGLGLAICNELVSLHRGKIEVQSRKGEGTTFSIVLPLKKFAH